MAEAYPALSFWIFESPNLILGHLNTVLLDVANRFYPGYESIHNQMFIKISDFPLEEKLRDLRTFHINNLIKVKGVITKKYPVY